MLEDNGRKIKQKYNYHMTDEEVKIMFKYCRAYYATKYSLVLSVIAFRGLRPQAALAINYRTDLTPDFKRLSWREAKTNKLQLNRPLLPQLSEMIDEYVYLNKDSLRDGFLFPYYTKKSKGRPFMSSQVLSTWFNAKLRRKIAKDHPQFMERYPFTMSNGKIQMRYRIGVYSLRRWFETRLHTATDSVYIVKEIMNYNDYKPLNSYLNRQRVMSKEDQIMKDSFSGAFQKAHDVAAAQTKLSFFT